MKLEDIFKKGKKFIICLSLVLLGFGSVYIVSCGDDGNGENGYVNKAPIADAGPNQPQDFDIDCFDEENYNLEGICAGGYDISNNIHPGQIITLDVSNSYDPEGSALEYLWTKISGPTANLSSNTVAKPYFTPSVAGDYVFDLEVSDGEKTSELDYVSIFVRENNSPSRPEISPADTRSEWEGNPISFIAYGSNDVDGVFAYEIVNSNLPDDPDISFNESNGEFSWPTDCNDSGNYSLDVRAKDDDGATSSTHTVTITVLENPTCSVPTN